MKKLLNYGLAALLATGLLFSCGDDDKQNDPTPTPTPTLIPTPIVNQTAKIDGSWHLISALVVNFDAMGNIIGTPKTQTYPRGQHTSSYSPPSTFTSTSQGYTVSGTYQIKQDSLITNIISPKETNRFKIDSLTTARLVFNRTFGNSAFGNSVVTYTFLR